MVDADGRRDGAQIRTRREFLLQAGAVAAVTCLLGVERAIAEEADQGALSKVHRYAGVRHLPIGQVGGADAYLSVDVPRGCYMLPRRPRSEALLKAGNLPLTWVWRAGCTPNWHHDSGALLVGVIPEAGADLRDRLLEQVPALVKVSNLRWTPNDVVRGKGSKLTVRGLPKATRSLNVDHFETDGAGTLQARYAMLLLPSERATTYVWVGEHHGGTLVKDLLKGLDVVPAAKRPAKSAPLVLTCPVGDWILRCGFAPPKGFVADFRPDIDAAARWTDGVGTSWALHIDPLEDVTQPPLFIDHHRKALTESIPDAEIEESVVKVGRVKIPLLTLVQESPRGPVRTAILGAQDGRARVSWIVEDAPGTGDDLARWGKGVVKEMGKRFHYWFVESYELQERQRKRER